MHAVGFGREREFSAARQGPFGVEGIAVGFQQANSGDALAVDAAHGSLHRWLKSLQAVVG